MSYCERCESVNELVVEKMLKIKELEAKNGKLQAEKERLIELGNKMCVIIDTHLGSTDEIETWQAESGGNITMEDYA